MLILLSFFQLPLAQGTLSWLWLCTFSGSASISDGFLFHNFFQFPLNPCKDTVSTALVSKETVALGMKNYSLCVFLTWLLQSFFILGVQDGAKPEVYVVA